MAQPTKVWSIRGVGMGDRMGRGWECGGRAVTTNSGDLESFENTFRRIPRGPVRKSAVAADSSLVG